jgi:hypothetical protein
MNIDIYVTCVDVSVLEKADGEGGQFNTTTNPKGMPNATTNLSDFMALVVFDAIEKVVKKGQGGFSPSDDILHFAH